MPSNSIRTIFHLPLTLHSPATHTYFLISFIDTHTQASGHGLWPSPDQHTLPFVCIALTLSLSLTHTHTHTCAITNKSALKMKCMDTHVPTHTHETHSLAQKRTRLNYTHIISP